MKKLSFYIITLIIVSFSVSCAKKEHNNILNITNKIVDSLQQIYAPDKRVAWFAITPETVNKKVLLKGSTTESEAYRVLKEQLNKKGIIFTDSVEVLPETAMQDKKGVINNSVANIRSNKGHSSELATQATLGTPVKIFKHDGDWYLVQTPDNYIAWVDHGGIVVLNNNEFSSWQATPKIIYTQTMGFSYSEPDTSSQVVSDLVAGSILALESEDNKFYKAKYPDGRVAYVLKKEAIPYSDWVANAKPETATLIETSKKLLGVPYLWGGTSVKGVDCSGFTKTIYFLNGMIIPRDASQQVHAGILVDDKKDFSKLQPGDLLFFGKKATDSTKEKVVHVGMWIGNGEFIHASGRVKINSMNKNAPNFDAFNYNRYLRTKRIAHQKTPELTYLNNANIFLAANNKK